MSEISELFDRDPLNLSEQDIATIVAYERQHQAQHELGAKPQTKPKARTTTKGADLLKELGLSPGPDLLKDLGFK
jgi:hypothetical protein